MQVPDILDSENAHQYTARHGLSAAKVKLSHLSILRWITPEILDFQNAVNDYSLLEKINCTLAEAKELHKSAVAAGKDFIEASDGSITLEKLNEAIVRIEAALA